MFLERDEKLDAVFAAQEAKYPVGRSNRGRMRGLNMSGVEHRRGGADFQTERTDIQGVRDHDVVIPVDEDLYVVQERLAREHLVFEAKAVFAASAKRLLAFRLLDAPNTASSEVARYLSQITTEPPLSRDLLTPASAWKERSVIFDAATVFQRVSATISLLDPVRSYLTALELPKPPSPPTPLPSPAFNKSAEPELPLRVEFVPSRQLLDLWVKSLNSYLDEAKILGGTESVELFSIVDDRRRLEREFHKRLRGALVRQAVIYSYSKKVYHLTVGHVFPPTFMAKISEEFLIRADLGTPFFQLLFNEVSAWVQAGRKISGTWGYLGTNEDADLVYYLQRSKVRKVRGFTALSSGKKPENGQV